jgi:hypothetical protein
MPKTFISYRREHTAGDARALVQDLAEAFGADRVFIDVSLRGGSTWPAALRGELTAAPVVLVLFSPEWLTARDQWNRRLIDSSSDWVRLEIELALDDPSKLVIPVLLDGAELPPAVALPESLYGLVDRQARTVSYAM